MSDRHLKEYGIILRATNSGEKSKLLYIFLQNSGVVKAYAHGAKNSKRRFGGNLEPFNLQFFNISSQKEFYSILDAKIVKLFLNIRKNLQSIEMLQNISKILISLPIMDSKRIFKLFYFLLSSLDKKFEEDEKQKIYYFFLIYLFFTEGFFPQNSRCFMCDIDGENLFVISEKYETNFICQTCLKNFKYYILSDLETSRFVRYSLKSSKKLIETKFSGAVYSNLDRLCKIILKQHLQMD